MSRFLSATTSRFPALGQLQFRRYFVGQAIALIGGFAHSVAMSWLGFRLTGSVAVLGWIGFASLAPAIVISPLAGVLADRYPRRQMLIGILSFVALLGILLAVLTHWHWIGASGLIVIALLRGFAFALEIPIRHAFLVDLIDDRAVLTNAVALHSTALNTARFIGPAVGGVLIGSLGEEACFILHPVLLCATLFQLWRIQTIPGPSHRPQGSAVQQVVDGWRHAFADPVMGRLLVGVFALGFGVGPYVHLMPAAVSERFGAHPELVGLFISCAGIGAMTAAISLAARRGSHHLSRIALAGNVSAGAGLLVFCLSRWMPLSVIAMVFVGFGVIVQAVATNMTIQKRADDDKRGRVLALYTAMFIGATPIGSLVFGQIGLWTGATGALLIGALLALAGAALMAWRMRS